jgi:hypothetical protein
MNIELKSVRTYCGSHSGSYEKFCFCDVASCSPLKITCLAYSSTLKMETIYSSETPEGFQGATRRYIPEELTHVAEYASVCKFLYYPVSYAKLGMKVVPPTPQPHFRVPN